MKKYLWLDTETTGLSTKAGLIQIAGIIAFGNEVKEEFSIRMNVFPDDLIEQSALDINKMTREDIASFQSPASGKRQFETILAKYVEKFDPTDKFILGGFNCSFDLDHMFTFYRKNNDKYLGSWISTYKFFDVFAIIKVYRALGLLPDSLFLNNKLATVCAAFDVGLYSAHDALADIRVTRDIGLILINHLSTLQPLLKEREPLIAPNLEELLKHESASSSPDADKQADNAGAAGPVS